MYICVSTFLYIVVGYRCWGQWRLHVSVNYAIIGSDDGIVPHWYPLRPSDAFMRQSIMPSLAQMLACHLFDVKLFYNSQFVYLVNVFLTLSDNDRKWRHPTDTPSYWKIWWNLGATRSGFRRFQSLLNLTGTSGVALPRWLSNFRVWLL